MTHRHRPRRSPEPPPSTTPALSLVPVADGVEPRVLRDVYGCFPSGVAAVCTMLDGTPAGMAVSSFTSVSLDPPLVSVCVDNGSTTWPRLRAASHLGVSVLGESHEAACRRLAAKTGDRFQGLTLHATAEGALLVQGATAWLDCTVEAELSAGDHVIVLLRITALQGNPDTAPLVFHRSGFRQLSAVTT